jgi:hypothetical protein
MTENNSTDQAVVDAIDEALSLETDEVEETEEKAELTVAEVVEDLTSNLPDEFGPYQIWKVLRAAAEVLEIDVARVTSQYMYNYSRNGMIAKRETRPNKDHSYTKGQANAFLVKYLEKRI